MAELIACLGAGKGTWGLLGKLINAEEWDLIVLITNAFGAERFSVEGRELKFIVVDDKKSEFELTKDITEQLKEHIKGVEVALNLNSGDGKVHMALLSAVLKAGVGIRLISVKDDKVEEV